MDERDLLESEWAGSSFQTRVDLFTAWITAATAFFEAPELFVVDSPTEPVAFNIAPGFSAWQIAVAASLFSNAAPTLALGIGDGIIEAAHLFKEQADAQEGEEEEEEEGEEEEEVPEDESPEAEEFLVEQAIEALIEELEGLVGELQDQLAEADEGDEAAAGSLAEAIDELNGIIGALKESIGQFDGASD